MKNCDDIRVVQAARDKRVPQEITALGAPYLRHLIDDIESEQSNPLEVVGGRWFQRSLLLDSHFTVLSPWDRKPARATQSVLLEDKTIAYGFGPALDFWLISGSLGEGSPIQGIYLPGLNTLLNLGDQAWGITAAHVKRAMSIFGHLPPPAIEAPRAAPVTLVTGDASFAHHAWNQLGALDGLVKDVPAIRQRKLDVLAMQEPLGPLSELFDDCPGWSIRYAHASQVEALNRRDSIFVHLGGKLVTEGARGRVFKVVRRIADLPEHARQRNPAGRFWLSIRTRNRTITNQAEFLTAMANGLVENFPGCDIVLDGHSFSEDDHRLVQLGDKSNHEIAAADMAVADKVAASIITGYTRIYRTAGRPLSFALALAETCDYYVCHHGTVQHKIGWFTRTPGMVHANGRITRSAPAASVAAQAEACRTPTYLPGFLIRDETMLADDALANALRHENYAIDPVHDACRTVLDDIVAVRALASTPSGRSALARISALASRMLRTRPFGESRHQ